MECKYCGMINPEGSTFCASCGKPINPQNCLDPDAVVTQEVEATTEPDISDPAPAFCPSCGAAVDAETVFCGTCGVNIRPVSDEPVLDSTMEKKRSGKSTVKKILLIAGIVLASLLLIFVIAGLCTNWFGLNGPITQIGVATANTFQKHNFSAEFELSYDDQTMDGIIYFDMDVKEEIVQMYVEANISDQKYIIAIYDDTLIYGSEDDLSTKDVSYFISSFCDAIDNGENKSITFNEAWDILIDMIPNKQQEEINEDYVNLKTLKKLVKSFLTGKLNNASWLKENAGYSVSNSNGVKIHSFEPEIDEFLNASVEHFEDAFVKSSVYKDVIDAIEQTEEFSDKTDIRIDFGIKGGKLVLLEAEVAYNETTVSCSCEFYDIGKTEIDEDLLDDLLDEAEMNN